jgi:hypothetical protein
MEYFKEFVSFEDFVSIRRHEVRTAAAVRGAEVAV